MRVPTHKVVLPIVLALVVATCGDGAISGGEAQDADGGIQIPVENSCDLADAEMVETAFGGTVAAGFLDESRACRFEITGGTVDDVAVQASGAASTFEGVRSGYHDNFDGTFDVAGIGDQAFYPGLHGPLLLVVSARGQVFVVNAHDSFAEAPPGTEEMVADLARAIVARLGG